MYCHLVKYHVTSNGGGEGEEGGGEEGGGGEGEGIGHKYVQMMNLE